MRRSQGMRNSSRHRLRVRPSDRGLPSITKILQEFEIGDKAAVVIDGRILKGQPHISFQGLTGTVVAKRGSAYLVEMRVGNKMKTIISAPVHLKKLKV